MKGIPLSLGLLLKLALILHSPQSTSAQVSDPCNNFTVLNDTWRSTNYSAIKDLFCDIDIERENWHVFILQGERVRMADQCVQPYLCGTLFPLWMNGSHPRPEDGIVSRNVCTSIPGNCCPISIGNIPILSIQVKTCPGDYAVYKLVNATFCPIAYCADANFHPTPMTTSSTKASTTAIYTTKEGTESTTDDDRCEDIFCNACSKTYLSSVLLVVTLILFLSA